MPDPTDELDPALLLEHRQNLNSDFNNLGNYFMLAQSFLLAMSITVATGPSTTAVGVALPLLGLVLTLVWLFVQVKQRAILESVKRLCELHVPTYRALKAARRARWWDRISSTLLQAYLLPLLFLSAWVVVLVS